MVLVRNICLIRDNYEVKEMQTKGNIAGSKYASWSILF